LLEATSSACEESRALPGVTSGSRRDTRDQRSPALLADEVHERDDAGPRAAQEVPLPEALALKRALVRVRHLAHVGEGPDAGWIPGQGLAIHHDDEARPGVAVSGPEDGRGAQHRPRHGGRADELLAAVLGHLEGDEARGAALRHVLRQHVRHPERPRRGRRGVHEGPHARFLRGGEQGGRAVDVGGGLPRGVRAPRAGVGRGVEDGIAALERRGEAGDVVERGARRLTTSGGDGRVRLGAARQGADPLAGAPPRAPVKKTVAMGASRRGAPGDGRRSNTRSPELQHGHGDAPRAVCEAVAYDRAAPPSRSEPAARPYRAPLAPERAAQVGPPPRRGLRACGLSVSTVDAKLGPARRRRRRRRRRLSLPVAGARRGVSVPRGIAAGAGRARRWR
jgi:hypothetical protein